MLLEDPKKINGPSIVYTNVGARYGVLGKPVEVNATPALLYQWANMTVKLVEDGKELDSGKGDAILGHPMNVVLWLVADLKKSGGALKQGDLLSLGQNSS